MIENKYLLTFKKVRTSAYSFPDLKINSGLGVFIESKDILFSNIFISLILGQFKKYEGSICFSGTSPTINNFNKVSYISNSFFFPDVKSLEEFIYYTAKRKGFMPSKVFTEFSRILKLLNLDYVFSMPFNDVNFNNRKKIITALTLAMPMLLIVICEPFIDIEKEAKQVFFDEINNLLVDGSSVIVLASEADNFNYNLFY